MEKNNNIPIKNIFYMLAYTFNINSQLYIDKLNLEDFTDAYDMYVEALLLCLPVIIKGGLEKDYMETSEKSSVLRGKLDLIKTINETSLVKNKLDIDYDEFTDNVLMNQIIHTTLINVLRSEKTASQHKKKIRKYVMYFSSVALIEIYREIWHNIHFSRNNARYKLILFICRMIQENQLITESAGENKTMNIDESRTIPTVFEKFVLKLLKKETNFQVWSPHIEWDTDDGFNDYLPLMKTDIVVRNKNKTLIIDTKYYTENMQTSQFKNKTHISSNLYQIYTYVNNWNHNNDSVSGLLLYAKTRSSLQPNHHYRIKGNDFFIYNIDLNQSFEDIKQSVIFKVNDILIDK